MQQTQADTSECSKKHQEIGLTTVNTCWLLCSDLYASNTFMLGHVYWSRNIPWHIFQFLHIFNYPALQPPQFLSNYGLFFPQTFAVSITIKFDCQLSELKISCHFVPTHRRHFHCLRLIYSLSFVLILTNRDALKTCWCGTLHVNTAQLLRYMSPINLRTLNAGKQGEKKAPILEKYHVSLSVARSNFNSKRTYEKKQVKTSSLSTNRLLL